MMKKIDDYRPLLRETGERLRQYALGEGVAFFKWCLLSILVGLSVGVVGAGLHHAVEIATELRLEHPWLLYLLPLAGLIIVGLYRLCGMGKDKGTDFVLASVRDARVLKPQTVPLIFVATTLTHLCGGSAGREGAALQVGGVMAASLGRLLRLEEKDERMITMAGMAAGFSALFGTPLAAAVFALEVVSVGLLHYAAIVPCFLSALIANITANALGCGNTAFALVGAPALTPLTLVQVVVLGVLCAVLANFFCHAMEGVHHVFHARLHNPAVRVVTGGVLVILLTLVFGRDYNGAGMPMIEKALAGSTVPWAFVLKILFTAITLSAGFKGGEIVPSFFVGATFGCLVSPLLGLHPGFGAAVGMVCVFCGVTNAPLASLLLAVELFGGVGLGLLAAAIAVSFLLSGDLGLYHEQHLIFSKVKPVFHHNSASDLPEDEH